jgi:arginase
MSVIVVPYHLDEHLPELDLPLPEGARPTVLTAVLPDADTWTRLATLYEPVAQAVRARAADGGTPVVVSGDCTVSLGVVAGLQRAGQDVSVVWFDAHGDVQTERTSTTGYLGGMPLRVLVGYRPGGIAERLGLRVVPEQRVLLVDARDLDPAEVVYLRTARIVTSTVDDVVESALPPGPLVLHLDLDVIDPAELPGMRVPAPGGPSTAAVLAAARRVLATGRVAALDLACTWLPGGAEHSAARAQLLAELVT